MLRHRLDKPLPLRHKPETVLERARIAIGILVIPNRTAALGN